jgi:hypothetical protein
MRILAMSEMAIARVHPAFGDFRFGELSHQLGGLWPPVSKTTVGLLFSLFLPRSHACALRAVSGRDGMLV